MPWSSPLLFPEPISFSACFASARALSRITVTTALYLEPSFSRRSRQPVASSTGESFLARMRDASSRTGRKYVASSIISASGVEGDVGLVAVRELLIAQRAAGGNPAVQLARDPLELVRRQILAIAAADDLGERARILGDLRARRGRRGAVRLGRRCGSRRVGRLRERLDGCRQRGREAGDAERGEEAASIGSGRL